MIDAGILVGDQAILKQQATAENGQIVCAMIRGEATLKRFYKKDGVVTLRAGIPLAKAAIIDSLTLLISLLVFLMSE